MAITIDQMVSNEVHYCVSALVSTLASGYGESISEGSRELSSAIEQAAELCYSIPDYEEAAIQEGWSGSPRNFKRKGFEVMYFAYSWQELCELEEIEPYEREVFEHWIVSNWLAEKLQEHGEKVDTDFCGMTVWARTTTGQGIVSDSVIERIYAELVSAS